MSIRTRASRWQGPEGPGGTGRQSWLTRCEGEAADAPRADRPVRARLTPQCRQPKRHPERRISRVATTAELSPPATKRPSGKQVAWRASPGYSRLAFMGADQHNDVIGDAV
jgi:hypothetical protein